MKQVELNRRPEAEAPPPDAEMDGIVAQEEKVLARVQRTLDAPRPAHRGQLIDYDAELISLRDQIREARLEDIPPLVEEMERLQQVAQRRAQVVEGTVDPRSPYFGRMVLEEEHRKREILIGRSTFLDSKTGVRIVDWRDAPVSRVYYRHEEGDDYDEIFGDREIEGEVILRRNLSITLGKLRRIGSPQGTFRCSREGMWRRVADQVTRLSGGQGAAMRPESHHRPGELGIGDDDLREDKHLSEITALIDPRQFELISQPTSGLVVIQGGAGSGKTTIGLHRLAYLAFQDTTRFRADQMLVIVFNDALVRYISQVLPALGVEDVPVQTFQRWAEQQRRRHLPKITTKYVEDTPTHVVRLKKHPAMLRAIDQYVAELTARAETEILDEAKRGEGGARVARVWRGTTREPLGVRLDLLSQWLQSHEDGAYEVPLGMRHAIGRICQRWSARTQDIVTAWADLLTDQQRLVDTFSKWGPEALTEREIEWVHSWCSRNSTRVLLAYEEALEGNDDDRGERSVGVDGVQEEEPPVLDREDDALLLRLYQTLRGPLFARRAPLTYEHIFVDEAQDMSPVELAVVLDTSTEQQSVTLAGDIAQKLHLDNGFSDWRHVLEQLKLDHIEIEPLKLSYRSTHEILEFATDVLGPLRNEVSGEATRYGAPVELFLFGGSGEVVGFLSEALRNLVSSEPLSSVALIARYPEQADLYYKGLRHGEVPNLRRIAEQDFPFRPGVDVTDVRQVKGLEFDYVVIVECNTATFPVDDETRHLLHIAATRAAHQLWVFSTGAPSLLLPESLVKASS
ncbi:MAG: ATP-binding domain-containing protein [Deltaproteobacteria bacterium]|nr:ATP-binding domain-containing protein [Deltaproteobacteria bacterium]